MRNGKNEVLHFIVTKIPKHMVPTIGMCQNIYFIAHTILSVVLAERKNPWECFSKGNFGNGNDREYANEASFSAYILILKKHTQTYIFFVLLFD